MKAWLEAAWARWLLLWVGSTLAVLLLAWQETQQAGLFQRPAYVATDVAGSPWLWLGVTLYATFWIFQAGLWLLLRALNWEWRPLAVARLTVSEALRRHVVTGFLLVLWLSLLLLPLAGSTGQPLQYRMQTFLYFAGLALTALLGIQTVFLGCAAISLEIQNRRIFGTFSKPISRGGYLLGKWLGLCALNALLLAVAGLALYGGARYISEQPARDSLDRMAVSQEVLTARVGVEPRPPTDLEQRVAEAVERSVTLSGEALSQDERAVAVERERGRLLQAWRTIAPRSRQEYTFENLHAARKPGGAVQLRVVMYMRPRPRDENVYYNLFVNGRNWGEQTGIVDQPQTIPIPAEEIGADGRLQLGFETIPTAGPYRSEQASLVLAGGDDFRLFFPHGAFAPNLARGLLILWLKLAFLAMLGLAASVSLSFPVACLLSFLVYLIAAASGFLLEATEYALVNEKFAMGAESIGWLLYYLIYGLSWLLGRFGAYTPVEPLSQGLLVPWSDVAGCALNVGVGWSLLLGLAAWRLLMAREVGGVTG